MYATWTNRALAACWRTMQGEPGRFWQATRGEAADTYCKLLAREKRQQSEGAE